MTRNILENFGYRVITASDGNEGISRFREHHHEIAAVITDMTMPGLDGPATIDGIRKIDRNTEVIAVSGIRSNGGSRGLSGQEFAISSTNPNRRKPSCPR